MKIGKHFKFQSEGSIKYLAQETRSVCISFVRRTIQVEIFWEVEGSVRMVSRARIEESLTGDRFQMDFIAVCAVVRRRIRDSVLVLNADAESVVAVRI